MVTVKWLTLTSPFCQAGCSTHCVTLKMETKVEFAVINATSMHRVTIDVYVSRVTDRL